MYIHHNLLRQIFFIWGQSRRTLNSEISVEQENMKEIKNNPYSIARSTLELLFPFSFQIELEKNVNHDLGWLIHPIHLFYVVTNFYYFPYYVMKADFAPYAVRLVSHYKSRFFLISNLTKPF